MVFQFFFFIFLSLSVFVSYRRLRSFFLVYTHTHTIIWHICCPIDACCSFIWIIFQPFDFSIGRDSFFLKKKNFLFPSKEKTIQFLIYSFWFFPVQYIYFWDFFFLFSKFGFNFFLFFLERWTFTERFYFFSTKYKKMDKKENNQPLPKESVTIESIFISISHIFCWSTTHTYIIPNLTLVSSFLSSWFLCMFFS